MEASLSRHTAVSILSIGNSCSSVLVTYRCCKSFRLLSNSAKSLGEQALRIASDALPIVSILHVFQVVCVFCSNA